MVTGSGWSAEDLHAAEMITSPRSSVQIHPESPGRWPRQSLGRRTEPVLPRWTKLPSWAVFSNLMDLRIALPPKSNAGQRLVKWILRACSAEGVLVRGEKARDSIDVFCSQLHSISEGDPLP